MSDNIAYALLVYTGLQIFVTMAALNTAGGSLLPYLALIILVAAIVPSCRRFERRWNRLDNVQTADPALIRSFRRDQVILWGWPSACHLQLPVLFTCSAPPSPRSPNVMPAIVPGPRRTI